MERKNKKNQSELEKKNIKPADGEATLVPAEPSESSSLARSEVPVATASESEKSKLISDHLVESNAAHLLTKEPNGENPQIGKSTEIVRPNSEKLEISKNKEENHHDEVAKDLKVEQGEVKKTEPDQHNHKVLAEIHTVEHKEENHVEMLEELKTPDYYKVEVLFDEPILESIVGHDRKVEEVLEVTKVVEFSVNYTTNFGEFILVVGSADGLGSWNSEKGLKLEWNEGNVWKYSVKLPERDTEYKYVCASHDGQRWEEGDNRRVHFDEALHYDIWQEDV